jgi:hypothetical protein
MHNRIYIEDIQQVKVTQVPSSPFALVVLARIDERQPPITRVLVFTGMDLRERLLKIMPPTLDTFFFASSVSPIFLTI